MMQRTLLRLLILFALPAAIAAGDALLIRPTQAPAHPPPKPAPTDVSLAGPENGTPTEDSTQPGVDTAEIAPGDIHDIQVVIDHFNNGTAFFVDARPLDQYTESHILGSYHLPFEAFLKGKPGVLDVLPTELPLVIYCGGGDCDASHKVEKMLRNYGYTDLFVFVPGFPAWQQAELPVSAGPPESF